MKDKAEGSPAASGPCRTVGEFVAWCMKRDGGIHWLRAKISASLQAWGEQAEAAAYKERDAEWREALRTAHYDSIDGLHYNCAECAPLAALLASAASDQKGPHDPALLEGKE